MALAILLTLFGSTFLPAPLPPLPPLSGPMPAASPPAEMAVFQLPTGVIHRSAGIGYRGGSLREARDFAVTAVLVKHPRGDLLVDTGFGRDIATQIQSLPLLFRLLTPYERYRSAREQLDAAGYDRRALRGVVLTHAHWDHTSGLAELPGTPVLVTPAERRFIAEGGTITSVTRGLPGVRYEEYAFEGGPYLGYPQSHDVHGDGSIVIVPAPGHTPGSVIVFLALPDGTRFALVGDLAWQREGILEREPRPWLPRLAVDSDEGAVRAELQRMSAIAAQHPHLVIVPAHDARGFAAMPSLPAHLGPAGP
jgi:glyoxylase-like metal-dependent hydrolase (beta-lactamase superfamily II)